MKIISFCFLALCAMHLSAQTSKEVLDKLSNKAKGYGTITADFISTLQNAKTGANQTQKGSVKIKGSKYKVILGDYSIWCDGTTVWNYNKSSNEVTIDNLSDVKDGGFDPSELFTIWEKDFKHEMKNTNASVGGVGCYQIALNPINPKNKSYHTITMYVDKIKLEIVRVEVKTRENASVTYDIKSFRSGVELLENEFRFDKGKFPGVSEVDNRI
jgi:outer membrane lipoprotein carrier protein